MNRSGAVAAIDGTPVVRLGRLVDEDSAEVWVKLEGANPTGSYKDRMALAMIEGAEADGRLKPGQLVVEYTGGSTGSSLAFVCAVKGYPRLGEELLDELPGPPPMSAFCGYIGTAGCFLGTTRALRAALPDLHRVAVEPAESAVLSGRPAGTHHIEGGGAGFWPPQLTP